MNNGGSSQTVYSAANGSFPGTNITATYGGSTMAYLNVNSTGFFYHGMNGSGVVFTYQDPMQTAAYPYQMNATHTDDFHATFTSGMPFERFGDCGMTVDGYGTLITPEGTFTDVVRVHFTQDYKDSNDLIEINYDVDIYAWYKAGIHNELASVSTLVSTQGNNIQYGGYMETAGLGITEEELQALTIFPNPATTTASVRVSEQASVEGMTVTDLNGKTYEVAYTREGAQLSFDVSGMAKGMYFLRLTYGSGAVQQGKLVVD
jgi:hypothetical protein